MLSENVRAGGFKESKYCISNARRCDYNNLQIISDVVWSTGMDHYVITSLNKWVIKAVGFVEFCFCFVFFLIGDFGHRLESNALKQSRLEGPTKSPQALSGFTVGRPLVWCLTSLKLTCIMYVSVHQIVSKTGKQMKTKASRRVSVIIQKGQSKVMVNNQSKQPKKKRHEQLFIPSPPPKTQTWQV